MADWTGELTDKNILRHLQEELRMLIIKQTTQNVNRICKCQSSITGTLNAAPSQLGEVFGYCVSAMVTGISLPSAFCRTTAALSSAPAALPLVGEGRAYTHLGIPNCGSETMPSGGFIYMDGRQLVRFGRWLTSTDLAQLKAVRSWAKLVGYWPFGDYVYRYCLPG